MFVNLCYHHYFDHPFDYLSESVLFMSLPKFTFAVPASSENSHSSLVTGIAWSTANEVNLGSSFVIVVVQYDCRFLRAFSSPIRL